jgi:hypothetical protein
MNMAVFWVVSLISVIMEAESNSETSVNFYLTTTRCTNPEGSHFRTRRHEDLKSNLTKFLQLCFLSSFIFGYSFDI